MAVLHLVWIRNDLRTADHPALHAAAADGASVLTVFIWSPEEAAGRPPGAASRWWLHHSLGAFQQAVARRGGRLIIRRGPADTALWALVRETGAEAVYFQGGVEPWARTQEDRVVRQLKAAKIPVHAGAPDLLVNPGAFLNRSGEPFKVFTPFWKAAIARLSAPAPLPEPSRWANLPAESLEVADLDLLPKRDWAGGLVETWRPGEAGAWRRIGAFMEASVARYPEDHDIPGVAGTSRLSPHLHFGEIGVRALFHALTGHMNMVGRAGAVRGGEAWLRQLYWREFGHYLLWHFPHTVEHPLHAAFERFPWRDDPAALRAWQRGCTGYPMVDAGMRELWRTGWMHNRVRMIAASFLVKDLLIPWQAGAAWFRDTLVDADLANNTLGWQWAAGCGADAAPYFRVFNPVLQGRKFDPDGAYVRRWVPELAGLDNKSIHEPWRGPGEGVDGYPAPVVDHAGARDRALLAYKAMKQR